MSNSPRRPDLDRLRALATSNRRRGAHWPALALALLDYALWLETRTRDLEIDNQHLEAQKGKLEEHKRILEDHKQNLEAVLEFGKGLEDRCQRLEQLEQAVLHYVDWIDGHEEVSQQMELWRALKEAAKALEQSS